MRSVSFILDKKTGKIRRGLFTPTKKFYLFLERMRHAAQQIGCGVRRLSLTEKQEISQRMYHPRRDYVFSESLSNAAQL